MITAKQRAKLRQIGKTLAILEQQCAGMRRTRDTSREFCRVAKERIATLEKDASYYRNQGYPADEQKLRHEIEDLHNQIVESNTESAGIDEAIRDLISLLAPYRATFELIQQRARLSRSQLGVPTDGEPSNPLASPPQVIES